jgi:hypothetical protein
VCLFKISIVQQRVRPTRYVTPWLTLFVPTLLQLINYHWHMLELYDLHVYMHNIVTLVQRVCILLPKGTPYAVHSRVTMDTITHQYKLVCRLVHHCRRAVSQQCAASDRSLHSLNHTHIYYCYYYCKCCTARVHMLLCTVCLV